MGLKVGDKAPELLGVNENGEAKTAAGARIISAVAANL